MKILIADDSAFSRKLLERILLSSGHEVIICKNGNEAMKKYAQYPSIEMAILDWMMPGASGIEICNFIKEHVDAHQTYVIILTARNSVDDLSTALCSGADDFIAKPFSPVELEARVNAGIRIVNLQQAMAKNIRELRESLSHVKQLQGIIPICAWCKKIRDDSRFWSSVEQYFSRHSEIAFSHSMCPECETEWNEDDADVGAIVIPSIETSQVETKPSKE